jgi:L-rhamnose-H+ transport protein
VAICSFAGRWKERQGKGRQGKEQQTAAHRPQSYWKGVAICVASGLFSACGNLGFAFGAEIAERAASLGASDALASNALWTLLTLPLFACNAGYAGYLLWRNRSARLYRNAGSPLFLGLAILMGILWMAGFGLYGVGARMVGHLGPSLGWGILMASMVLVANLLGLLSGEWRQAPSEATRRLSLGIAALLLAIAGLGYANHLQAGT